MVGKQLRRTGVILGLSLLLVGAAWRAGHARSNSSSGSDPALEQKVTQFIREKFGLSSSVKLTAQAPRPYSYPAFEEMPIIFDDGKKSQTQTVYFTKDRHYLIVGTLFPVGSDARAELIQRVHDQFKIPDTSKITAGPLRSSPYPGFLVSTVTVDNGKQKQTQDFYVTHDNRILILGSIADMTQDLRRDALRTLSLQDQPSQGPARAPVTLVEFADLECPSCAAFHAFLEKTVLPKYEGKVRIVFKEFPLVQVHDWSLTAAIANECVYQMNPAAYVPFRSMVFQSQGTINAANVRDTLLNYGEQVGVDRVRLAGCVDSKASLPRIEQDLKEGERVNVHQTPTIFINGKMLVGMPPQDAFFKEIDDALAGR